MKKSYEPIPKAAVTKPTAKRPRRIKVKSERRYSENEYREAIRQQVFERDGGCLLFGEPGVGECRGPDTPHHVLKASAGGAYDAENLRVLCARHNVWVEDNPIHAQRLGLVKHWWEAS